jgi:hypothetical protein
MLEYDGLSDLRLDRKSLKHTHTLYLTRKDGSEVKVENWADDEYSLSRAKLGPSSPVPYIDWIVTAPDMYVCYMRLSSVCAVLMKRGVRIFDWCLRAETWGDKTVSEDVLGLLKTIKRRDRCNEDEFNFLQPSEVVLTKDPGYWNSNICQTRLKTSFIAEFQDSPYVLEISISQVWEALKTRAPEEKIIWQMEFYGKHWDSALNQVNPVDQRKDFGEGLKNIWVGSDPDLEKRF